MYLTIWTEKIEGKGEDAPPTLLLGDDDTGLLAVYDGLGGAGSKTYILHGEEQPKSGAYIASRLAKKVLEEFYVYQTFEEGYPNLLRVQLEEVFGQSIQEIETTPSKLRSKLIKRLPTTLAGIYFELEDDNQLNVQAFWAGDSRCYVLTPTGLQQISEDDLHGQPDALENLLEDATISNCISAEGSFSIHTHRLILQKPCILFTATDGCFAYFSSPAHFEYILLQSLIESYYDLDDWRIKLEEKIGVVTGDDVSLSMVTLGFTNLNEIKNLFFKRFQEVYEKYIHPLESYNTNYTPEISEIRLKEKLWSEYKIKYYLSK